jgi:hypothetical protein
MPSLNGAHIKTPIPLIHTTDLNAQRVDLGNRTIDISRACLRENAVLIPRVGRPTPLKVCLVNPKGPVALSNCIMALKCQRKKDATVLHRVLLKNWSSLSQVYGGTCAQYLTLSQVRQFLHTLGFQTSN